MYWFLLGRIPRMVLWNAKARYKLERSAPEPALHAREWDWRWVVVVIGHKRRAASVAGWLLYPPHWMFTGVVDYDGIFKRVIIVIPDERKGMDGKAYGRMVTFSWTAASFFFSTAYERGSRMVSIWTWFWFYSWILMLEGTLQALLKIWSFLFQFQKLYHSFIIKERKNHVEKQQASASLEIYCVPVVLLLPIISGRLSRFLPIANA